MKTLKCTLIAVLMVFACNLAYAGFGDLLKKAKDFSKTVNGSLKQDEKPKTEPEEIPFEKRPIVDFGFIGLKWTDTPEQAKEKVEKKISLSKNVMDSFKVKGSDYLLEVPLDFSSRTVDPELNESFGILAVYDQYVAENINYKSLSQRNIVKKQVPEILLNRIVFEEEDHPFLLWMNVNWSCATKKMLYHEMQILQSQENFDLIVNQLKKDYGQEHEFYNDRNGILMIWKNPRNCIILKLEQGAYNIFLGFYNYENIKEIRDSFENGINKVEREKDKKRAAFFK